MLLLACFLVQRNIIVMCFCLHIHKLFVVVAYSVVCSNSVVVRVCRRGAPRYASCGNACVVCVYIIIIRIHVCANECDICRAGRVMQMRLLSESNLRPV